ncbi:MAG: adenosylcobinamide-GDP ribazoletransferase [Anaerolineae bacterium]
MTLELREVEKRSERKGRQKDDSTASPAPVLVRFLAPPIAALQFLTIVPPLVRRPFTSVELGRAVGYFPLAGVLLGGLLAGLNTGLRHIFPAEVVAALALSTWVIFTGALHFDGFLDACDGLFGGQDPEMRLRILRDERVGAYAVAGGVLLLLTKYVALAPAPNPVAALILAPMLGRWGMALAVIAFPYARVEGLGRAMKDHAGWTQAIVATGIALVTAWFASRWMGLALLVMAGSVTWLAARFALGRLPGLTGDIYGAICELVETAVLLVLVAGGSL